MFRTPTDVLMMIGQIEVMKITNSAEGWASRKPASDSGSHASGGTVQNLEDRIEPAHRPGALSDQHAERDADHRGQAEADGDPAEALGDLPEGPLVDAAIVEEGIGDEVP